MNIITISRSAASAQATPVVKRRPVSQAVEDDQLPWAVGGDAAAHAGSRLLVPRRNASPLGHRDATSARARGTGERRDAGRERGQHLPDRGQAADDTSAAIVWLIGGRGRRRPAPAGPNRDNGARGTLLTRLRRGDPTGADH